jgi:hypothetical protein
MIARTLKAKDSGHKNALESFIVQDLKVMSDFDIHRTCETYRVIFLIFIFYSGECVCCRVVYSTGIEGILNQLNSFSIQKSWNSIVNYSTQKLMYYYCIPH